MRPTTTSDKTRTYEKMTIRKKYLIVTEGQFTERKYFESLSALQSGRPNRPLVDIVVIGRYLLQDGLSDPLRVVRLTDEYIHMLKTGVYSEKLLIGRVIESALMMHRGFGKKRISVAEELHRLLKKEKLVDFDSNITNSDRAFSICLKYLEEEHGICGLELVEDQIHYDDSVDDVCIVVDWDSRPEGEFKRFFSECADRGYRPFLTNPKFEFWLLMHYDISGITKNLKDPETVKKTVNAEMKKRGIGKKSDMGNLVVNVGLALENSSLFETKLDNLLVSVGSNLPALMKELGCGNDGTS